MFLVTITSHDLEKLSVLTTYINSLHRLRYHKLKFCVLHYLFQLFNLIGFICIQSSAFWANGRGVYFNIVAHLGLWFSGILLVLYLFHVVEKYHNVKWLKIEMIACVVMVFLYLIASTTVVAFGAAAYSAAGVSSQLLVMFETICSTLHL